MKVLKILFYLSSIACAFACSSTSLPVAIVGGEDSTIKKFPFIGSMVEPHVCGGSLIHPKYVLTAAHCLFWPNGTRIRAGQIEMSFGTKYFDEDGSEVFFAHAEVHKLYDRNSSDYDIALLKLTPRSATRLSVNKKVKTVKYATKNEVFGTGTEAWIAGWGRLNENATSLPNILHEAKISVVNFQRCYSNYYQAIGRNITHNMICAGTSTGGVNTCKGDSGGPLVTKKNNEYYLIGVTSFAYGCATKHFPTVFASIPALRDFIDETVELFDRFDDL